MSGAKLKFVKYRSPKSKFEALFISKVGAINLIGMPFPFDMPPADLHQVEISSKNVIEEINNNRGRMKYACDIKMREEGNRITFYSQAVTSNNESLLCGFELIQSQNINEKTMAKSNSKPEDKSPGQQKEIQYVPLKEIYASPTNPRKYFDPAGITELATSIKTHGVIQPVTLREKKGPARYELVCGERRWKSSSEAGMDTIPAIIRELSDDEVIEIQFTENLQRQDVHPMDEAVTFKAMVDTGRYTIEDIAAKVAKTPAFVTQRISLNNLIPELQKEFWSDKFQIAVAIMISRLTPSDQKECLKDSRGNWGTVKEVKKFIDCDITRKLSAAPFKRDDATLVPKAGPCTTCTKRSGCQPLLFADIKEEDRCFDQACFKSKMDAFVLNKVKSLIEVNPETKFMKAAHYNAEKVPPAIEKLLKEHNITLYDQNSTNSYASSGYVSAKFFVVNGSEAGKTLTRYIRGKAGSTPTKDGKPAKRTALHIDDEIDAIKAREKRAIELDGEKIWSEVRKDLIGDEELMRKVFHTGSLDQLEKTALANALEYKIHSDIDEYIKPDKSIKRDENRWKSVTDEQINILLRMFLIEVLADSFGSHITKPDSNGLAFNVVKKYLPAGVGDIEFTYAEKAAARAGRVKKRIEALQAEKKTLPEPKPSKNTATKPAPKKSSKKPKPEDDDDDFPEDDE